jgi:hypothetical protein
VGLLYVFAGREYKFTVSLCGERIQVSYFPNAFAHSTMKMAAVLLHCLEVSIPFFL